MDDLDIDSSSSIKFDLTKVNPQILRLLIVIGIYLIIHTLINTLLFYLINKFKRDRFNIASHDKTKTKTIKKLKEIIIKHIHPIFIGLVLAITSGIIFKLNFGISLLLYVFIINSSIGIIIRNIIFGFIYELQYTIDLFVKRIKIGQIKLEGGVFKDKLENKFGKGIMNNGYINYKKMNKYKPIKPSFSKILINSFIGFTHMGYKKILKKEIMVIVENSLKINKIDKETSEIIKKGIEKIELEKIHELIAYFKNKETNKKI